MAAQLAQSAVPREPLSHWCQVSTIWPEPGAIVAFGGTFLPRFSIVKSAGRQAEVCGDLCVELDDGAPLCRPAEDVLAVDALRLDGLALGHHRLRLRWKSELDGIASGRETASESWFHVTTDSAVGSNNTAARARAHLIDFYSAGEAATDSHDPSRHPISFCQFDNPLVTAEAYVRRYNLGEIRVVVTDSESDAADALLPKVVGTVTGSKAAEALWPHMKKELILKELKGIATGESPSGTYFPLRDMWERNGAIAFDENAAALLLIFVKESFAPDEQLARALLSVLESAVEKRPGFAVASHLYLDVAWSLRNTGEPAAAVRTVERAARATYHSIISRGPPLRRRGDPRRPVGGVMLLTMASESTPELDLLRRSASAGGLELIVDDGGAGGKWLGFGNRLLRMRKLLEGVGDNTLVLHVDAYDTLFLPTSARDVAKRFLSAGADIVFNADAMCSPDRAAAPLYPGYLAARKAFLNAGAYIGRASDVRVMLDEALDEMRRQEDEFGVDLLLGDDQRMLTRYFLRHRGGACSYGDFSKYGAYGGEHVALDVEQALVLTLHSRTIADMEISAENGSMSALLRYKPTGTMPFLLHGNGFDGKELLKVISDKLGALGWPPHQ